MVEVADHGAEVEGPLDGVQLDCGSWNSKSVGYDGAWNGRPDDLHERWVVKACNSAAKCVEEESAGSRK